MKAQLGTSQLYKELSSLSTPATPAAQPWSALRLVLSSNQFFSTTVIVMKAGSTIATLFLTERTAAMGNRAQF